MSEIIFLPTWITPPGNFGNYIEGTNVHIPLNIIEIASVSCDVNQYFVDVGSRASTVETVTINGNSVPFTINNQTEVWFDPLVSPSLVVITTSPASISLSILDGDLPYGLDISNNPLSIGGVLIHSNYPETINLEFTVRAKNEWTVRDRTFSMTIIGIIEADRFDTTIFPTPINLYGINFSLLGVYKRTEPVVFSIITLGPDDTSSIVSLTTPNYEPIGDSLYIGLPPGLSLNNGAISGYIDPECFAETYLFGLHINGQDSSNDIICAIEIVNDIFPTISLLDSITWNTPSGLIGSVNGGELSLLSVNATLSSGNNVTYSIVPGFGNLPPGLTIDGASGEIFGTLSLSAGNSLYSFRVRAQYGTIISDRIFNIQCSNKFTSSNLYNIFLHFSEQNSNDLLTPYQGIIDSNLLYRENDLNFGFSSGNRIYLLNGLDGSQNIENIVSFDQNSKGNMGSYYNRFSLILGEHYSAVAKDNEGNVIYEIIYRLLHDPQDKSGGYQFNTNIPIVDKVVYRSTIESISYVYPTSLRNLRYDMVNQIGFPVSNFVQQKTLGPTGPELLPIWMQSTQNDGSIPGYVPCIPIVYLKPGNSSTVLQIIADNKNSILNFGKVYSFDKIEFDLINFSEHVQFFDF